MFRDDRASRGPRRLPITLAAVIVASLFTLAPGSARPALAADPEAAPQSLASPATTVVGASAITPGSVNRTSVNLTASYAVTLALRYGSRAFSVDSTATITNTSGGPIDRVELNTIAARLGGMTLRYVQVDGVDVARRVNDQTIVVRLGGILAAGATVKIRVKYHATLRSTAQRLELAVHEGQRHRRCLSLDPVGQPRDPVQPAEPRRPVRHAGQPARAAPGRDRPQAPVRHQREPDVRVGGRPDADVRGEERPRRDDHGRARLQHPDDLRRQDPGSLLLPVGSERRDDPRRGRGRHPRLPGPPGPVPVHDVQGRPIGRRVRDGVTGPHLDPVRPWQREPALPRLARDGPPVVLQPRRQRPGPPAVRGRGHGRLPRSRDHPDATRLALLDRAARPVDLQLLERLLLRDRLHPGRQPAQRGAPADGLDGVLVGAEASTSRRTASA